jgi:uncharacterized iron-regulated protein
MRIVFFLLLSFGALQAQDLRAYQIYNAEGKAVSFGEMAEELSDADVVLFGELHNNPICHWLQFELTAALYAENDKLSLGAEMFERDNQAPLNLYLKDSIDAKALDSLARLWPNYETDYKGLVDFAKEKNLPFIATNAPRRYARLVYKGGFESLDTLSVEEKNWLATLPLPYNAELPGYKAMLEMMGGHGGENLPKAQAIKDATMAFSILENLERKGIFLHFNGDYHSKDFEGIQWYLKEEKKRLKIKTISTQIQDNVDSLGEESAGHADYTLVIDAQMTNSY